ncbi:tRNA threonylcarbamoyladenosine dehydratase [Hydrogenophilus thermoluteolus]|uniref:tRNA threonylcarbamoyladenosine dehydratase n=1 Tax=Hydrogenophilus thermoluteolus TaxID=297 RepID=A0A2Z6E0C9_HYDTE|nr:tRNA threonylcarbamoyladenosine dehydratase [Hydrogenophilus thermoluteolus]BBD78078.1 tRNA threonylcarbamoyladenosine dehydratase [Hydrogenophilus thermoluteolus]
MARSDRPRRLTALANLFGAEGVARLTDAHVAVVGLGGVGSWAAEALARSGVGRLTLIDMDVVVESNLNRQVQALRTTCGMAKVTALAERFAQIAPELDVRPVDAFVTPDNVATLLAEAPDGVIDATDDGKAKVALACWARESGTPLILAGAAGGKRDPTRIRCADLASAIQDPLLAKVRSRLRRLYGFPRAPRKMGVKVVFSDEPMVRGAACDAAAGLACAGYGSVVTVTGAMGFAAAQWMLDRLIAR